MTDKKSKIFLVIFTLVAIASITVTYYRYIVTKNFNFFTNDEAFNESLLEE